MISQYIVEIIGVVSSHQKFRIHQVKMFQKDKQKKSPLSHDSGDLQ